MKGKIAATVFAGVTAALVTAVPASATDSGAFTSGVVAESASTSAPVGVLDRPCSNRKQKLYFMGERDANFGGSGIVTILNCHATKRNSGIDVARGPDPSCKKIPFGETREFEYNRLKGIAEYRAPKWC
ncbi:hypothetical protein [Amycolatopsis antarctica]|nr:hypothetical protein [Amycolatopsis antarctica]